MKNDTRGIIPLWLAVTLGTALIGSGIVTIKKGFGLFGGADPTEAKQQAAALVESNAKLAGAEKTAADLRAKAEAAAQAVLNQKQLRYDAAAEDVAGVVIALEQEDAPSLNVTAALSFARSAAKALDPVAEARLAVLTQQVAQLTSQNETVRAQAAAALAAKDETIAAGRMTEAALTAQAAAENAARLAAETNAKTIGEAHTKLLANHATTLADMKTLAEKAASAARWLLWTLVLLGGVLWVLPIVAKAHPEVSWLTWIAKKSGACVAYGFHLLHEGEKKTLVLAQDETKALLAAAENKLLGVGAG